MSDFCDGLKAAEHAEASSVGMPGVLDGAPRLIVCFFRGGVRDLLQPFPAAVVLVRYNESRGRGPGGLQASKFAKS